jgi:hypothetical protein
VPLKACLLLQKAPYQGTGFQIQEHGSPSVHEKNSIRGVGKFELDYWWLKGSKGLPPEGGYAPSNVNAMNRNHGSGRRKGKGHDLYRQMRETRLGVDYLRKYRSST